MLAFADTKRGAYFIFSLLVDALVLTITDPILTAVQAVGDVKKYQFAVGILSLMNLIILDQNTIYLLIKILKILLFFF